MCHLAASYAFLHISDGSVQLLDLAVRGGLLHNIADLLFLGVREAVVPYSECVESGLSGEQDEQQ